MPTRLSASGRFSSPFSSDGSGSGSVFALRIFCAIVSASSVRLMRELSEASDFDIFLVPSRSDMTRVAGPVMIGAGRGKYGSACACVAMGLGKSLLYFWVVLRGGG